MQLLVRVVDKTSNDSSKNYELTKRGDVIAAKPDGADWGMLELTNPEWRIISVPDMSEAQANALLVPETPPLNNPRQICRKRAFKVDVDSLMTKGYDFSKMRLDKNAAQDAINTKKIVPDLVSNAVDISTAKVLKVQTDPVVIGISKLDVIG